jgi:hypothetical protein
LLFLGLVRVSEFHQRTAVSFLGGAVFQVIRGTFLAVAEATGGTPVLHAIVSSTSPGRYMFNHQFVRTSGCFSPHKTTALRFAFLMDLVDAATFRVEEKLVLLPVCGCAPAMTTVTTFHWQVCRCCPPCIRRMIAPICTVYSACHYRGFKRSKYGYETQRFDTICTTTHMNTSFDTICTSTLYTNLVLRVLVSFC